MFKDPRLRQLGLRLIHAEKPEELEANQRAELDAALKRRLTYQYYIGAPWVTLPGAMKEIDKLIGGASDDQVVLLNELKKHCLARTATLSPWKGKTSGGRRRRRRTEFRS